MSLPGIEKTQKKEPPKHETISFISISCYFH